MDDKKNYRVLLIEPLQREEWKDGCKTEKFFLCIKIELKDSSNKEKLDVGAFEIMDDTGVSVEFSRFEDGSSHYWCFVGGQEGLKPKDYTIPISEQSYKHMKNVAYIRFTVVEDGIRHQEELSMKDGLYSCAMMK